MVSGRIHKELGKYIHNAGIVRQRGKNGKITISIPKIDMPHFIFGKPEEGVGRGPGKDGDVVGHDKGKGKGSNGASDGEADPIEVNVDMEAVIKALGEQWSLPNMEPKQTKTFEEIKIKYNGISKIGPQALLHKRKTLLQTMKRCASAGLLEDDKKIIIPGYSEPISPLLPIEDDMRYRQWNEVKIPSSNAVIFFARDISGSMDQFKCEIVSDMAWWIDMWIRQFYKKTERVYVVHDTAAKEVDEKAFYKLRLGGGTVCSTALEYIAKQLKHRFPIHNWNIYVFYFTDGDNWLDDNNKFIQTIKEKLNNDIVNLIGITQILPWSQAGLKEAVDAALTKGDLGKKYVRTTGIDKKEKNRGNGWWGISEAMDEDERNISIRNAIRELLGAAQTDKQTA